MPTDDPIPQGSQKRVRVVVRDKTTSPARLADPDTLAITAGVIGRAPTTKTWPTDPEVVREGIGAFYRDVTCSDAGSWAADAEALGGDIDVATGEATWQVYALAFP